MSELGTPVTLKLFWDISFLFSVELWLLSSRYWCTTRGLTSIPALLFLPHWFSLQASSSIKRDFSQEGKKVRNNSQKTRKKKISKILQFFKKIQFTDQSENIKIRKKGINWWKSLLLHICLHPIHNNDIVICRLNIEYGF